jgi:hypothetical protein
MRCIDAPRHLRPPIFATRVAMLAGELLELLRVRTGTPDLRYAEPPTRLSGGYYTENHMFRLAGAPEAWPDSLVVRLFPTSSPPDLARREAVIQSVLADRGFPAARVLAFDDESRLDGRRFFVMALPPGARADGWGVHGRAGPLRSRAVHAARRHDRDGPGRVARHRSGTRRGRAGRGRRRHRSLVAHPRGAGGERRPRSRRRAAVAARQSAAGVGGRVHLPRRPLGRQHPGRRREGHRRARLVAGHDRRAGTRRGLTPR